MSRKKAGQGLATIYARALYDAAAEVGVLPQVQLELVAFQDTLRRYPRLALFLDSPTIPGEKKQAALSSLAQLTQTLTQPGLNFLRVLVKRERVDLLDLIVDAFREYCNQMAGIAEIDVATIRELEPAETTRLAAALQKYFERRVIVRTVVRPEILGGLVISHGGRVLNASLSHHLKRLMEQVGATRSGLQFYRD
jgi:F-type H+-transporting ATPase subunit delta